MEWTRTWSWGCYHWWNWGSCGLYQLFLRPIRVKNPWMVCLHFTLGGQSPHPPEPGEVWVYFIIQEEKHTQPFSDGSKFESRLCVSSWLYVHCRSPVNKSIPNVSWKPEGPEDSQFPILSKMMKGCPSIGQIMLSWDCHFQVCEGHPSHAELTRHLDMTWSGL